MPSKTEIAEDVGRPVQHERERPTPFRHLLRRPFRRIVRNRRGHDDNLHHAGPRHHRLVHLRCGADAHEFSDRRRLERRGAGDQRDFGAAMNGLGRNREPHLAAGTVADEAHRIEVFKGRPGGDQDALSAQRPCGAKHRFGGRDDLVGLRKPALSNPAARQVALARLDEPHAARGERVEILPDRLVREHLRVHRRRDEHRRPRGGIQRRQEIVGDPVRELADDIRRGGRDEQQIDCRRERDVLDVGIHAPRKLVGDDVAARDRLEGDRADELRRGVRHDRDDFVATFLQPARHFDGLVGANAAGHAESDQHLNLAVG